MGIFSRKDPEPPVRREVVRELLKLGMKETDAADCDIDSREFTRAKNAFDRAARNSTQAEPRAAHAALRRQGY
ncbi:hypothetical protein [Actinoplanes sp. NPDC049681]|uniref:hypothetical protein n=1 Tax=Actinoplanes sp. NPDC049681 TaxID=3363905 RepID=UPI00379B0FC9